MAAITSEPQPVALDGPPVARFAADAVLLDIEGTISPISFVRDTLFSYSCDRLQHFVDGNLSSPIVQEILAQAKALADGSDPVAALLEWQTRDIKAPPLKALQGLIWESGYREGVLRSPIFADALQALRQWKAAGLPLYIYSSGSAQAQRLFFEFSVEGDLRPLFSDYFDTSIGPKTESSSYRRISTSIGMAPNGLIFFSDNAKELEAARSSGLQAVHVVKDETPYRSDFIEISDYSQVELSSR